MQSPSLRSGTSPSRVPFAARPEMRGRESDVRRFARGAILASLAMAALGLAVATLPSDRTSPAPTRQAQAASSDVANNADELLTAIGRRREVASLPILQADPTLQTSSQQWADGLASRGVGHDPAILDGITDNWQQVSELVSAGPSFATASRALLNKAAGTSPLDDAKVTSIGIGQHVEGATTFVVVRLLRLPSTSEVNVQMGF